jgi:predicted peptidase
MIGYSLLPVLTLVGTLQQPNTPGTYTLMFPVPGGETMRYALTVPRGYNGRDARPLILALHPGGQRFPGYGAAFAQQVVSPGLSGLGAIIVAPDVPSRSWTDDVAERAVVGLVKSVMTDYKVDPSRVMVVGFSMGGRGAWFLSSRHTDVFKAAIVMAGSTGDQAVDQLATIPTYVIHSRDDEVVEFEPAEQAVKELKKLKRPIEFEPLIGPTHFTMGAYIDSLERGGRWVTDRWKK